MLVPKTNTITMIIPLAGTKELLKILKWLSSLTQWSSKSSPRPAASVSPRNLLEMQILWLYPRPNESETGSGNRNSVWTSPPGDSDACTNVRIYPATKGDRTDKKTEVQSRKGLSTIPQLVNVTAGASICIFWPRLSLLGYTLMLLLPAAHHKVRGLPRNAVSRNCRHY